MKGKKGNYMVAYNIQSAVDYDTKLIFKQSPTDHYEIISITKKAIQNINSNQNI